MNKMGFGFLRLPRTNPEDVKSTDYALLEKMVDCFIARGGRYFDTAYTYLGGESENALRETVVKRYPRNAFEIADKLPGYKVKQPGDCERFFEEQLRRCGVEFFDVYMLHWLNRKNYGIACAQDEFTFLSKLKAEGKARRIGFSYHDTAELLDEILTAHPEVDVVQLQINYLDWESEAFQARACYETAVKHGKPVIVMEPVRGGLLASLPEEAEALLKTLDACASPAQWALRFAQGLENVEICLSGMSDLAQVEQNMRDVRPPAEHELRALEQAAEIIKGNTAVCCTGCRYCVEHCPKGISIPDVFALYNEYCRTPDFGWKITPAYQQLTVRSSRASECIGCRACEANCPQKLPISEHMKKASEAFDR